MTSLRIVYGPPLDCASSPVLAPSSRAIVSIRRMHALRIAAPRRVIRFDMSHDKTGPDRPQLVTIPQARDSGAAKSALLAGAQRQQRRRRVEAIGVGLRPENLEHRMLRCAAEQLAG